MVLPTWLEEDTIKVLFINTIYLEQPKAAKNMGLEDQDPSVSSTAEGSLIDVSLNNGSDDEILEELSLHPHDEVTSEVFEQLKGVFPGIETHARRSGGGNWLVPITFTEALEKTNPTETEQ